MPARISLLLSTLLIAAVAPSASAQTPSTVADVRLDLLAQPPWHGPKDDLGIQVELRNVGDVDLEGYNLQVAVHPRISSRSELHASFDGEVGFQTSLFTLERTDEVIEADTSQVVTIDDPVITLSSLATAPADGGIYPLSLSLYDSAGIAALDVLTTPLVLYPRRVENPLHLSLVLPINEVPARDADGVFRVDADGSYPLEEAVAGGGWLDGLLDALEVEIEGGLEVGIAPSPRLMEEIADMADGFRRGTDDGEETQMPAQSEAARAAADVLDRMRELVAEEGVQTILTPYSNPDLPALVDFPEHGWLPEQIKIGEDVLSELDLASGRDWIFSPGNRVDAATLEQLALADAGVHTFFGPSSLVPELDPTAVACPDPRSPTFACPVSVDVPEAAVEGYAADGPLQSRLLEVIRDPDAGSLQSFYAETAMIHSELPGTTRVVQASLPPWQPDPQVVAGWLGTLTRAPWLSTITPAAGLELDLPMGERTVVPELPDSSSAPDASLYEAIAVADDVVDTYADIQPPETFVQDLNRNLLVAQSRTWWTDDDLFERGVGYVQQTRAIAEGELDKISLRAPGEITLTSEQGEITLSLVNEADYPVTVRITPTSDDVTFDPPTIEDTFEPGGASQFRIDVRSESSGIFPVNVRLETPNGEPIRPISIRVRSTSFNDIAVAITLGALAFLILWYAMRAVRKRRRAHKPASEATAS